MQKMERYEDEQGVGDRVVGDLDGSDSHRDRKEILKKKLELEYEARETEMQKESLEYLRRARGEIDEYKLQ